jgi:hypothetical protein
LGMGGIAFSIDMDALKGKKISQTSPRKDIP